MNILLISPKFFDYDTRLKAELERKGFNVTLLPDRPFKSHIIKGIATLFPVLFGSLLKSYYRNFLIADRTKYDLLLAINAQTVPPQFFAELKEKFPSIKSSLYVWDSIENRPNLIRIFPYFDKISSFDRQDCINHDIFYRPLFFIPQNYSMFEEAQNSDFDFDMGLVATAHSDRYSVLQNIKMALPSNFRFYDYLYIKSFFVFLYFKIFFLSDYKGAKMGDFELNPLPYDSLVENLSKCFAILDIHHPHQNGLTMRTIEILALKRKLITTNANIKYEPFYNPNNILIIDRLSPNIPQSFFETPYQSVPENVLNHYSCAAFINDILI